MAEVTLARIGELLRSVLDLLWNKPAGLPAGDVMTQLPHTLALTEYELGFAAGTAGPRFEQMVRLASIPIAQAGWITKDGKGRWFITAEGREACRRVPNAEALYKEALSSFDASRQAAPAAILAAELAGEQAWAQIRTHLMQMSPLAFRGLAAGLLHAMGYTIAWIAPPQKEHGQVDIVAQSDPVGTKGPRIVVQIRHKGQPVTMEGWKAFSTALADQDFGLLISSGGFTPEVSEHASTVGRRMALLDLEGFFDRWVEYYDQLSDDARGRLPLRRIPFLGTQP